MAGFFYKGIVLQQLKEPALSRNLREFFNADTLGATIDRTPVTNPDELTPDALLAIARQARIIDERDGRLLADKLAESRHSKPQVLVGDAIDDEPYISSQLNPLLQYQQLSAQGLQFAQRVCGANEAFFAVYKNLTDLEIRIPKKIQEFQVQRTRGRYPAEYQASKTFSANASTLMIGVGALIFLARAVLYNKPQTTAFITVAGDCIGNPTNLEISLGMTVAQTLERCGLIHDPARVVVGGSMTGIGIIDTERTVVTPVTRAILAFRDKAKDYALQCIGCARCAHVCPEGLNPYLLYRSARLRRFKEFRMLDAQMCIGCNTCSYVCPAKLDLSQIIRESAQEFRRMTGSMRAAAVEQKKREQEDFEEYMNDYCARKKRRAAQKTLLREETAAKHAAKTDTESPPAPSESPEKFKLPVTIGGIAQDSAPEQPQKAASGMTSTLNPADLRGSREEFAELDELSACRPEGLLETVLEKADETVSLLAKDKEAEIGMDESTALPPMGHPIQTIETSEAEDVPQDSLHGWQKNNPDGNGGTSI